MSDAESALLQSWHHNASSWIEAVRSASIESRRQVTDQAILLAVRSGASPNAYSIWVAVKAGCCVS